MTRFLVLLQPLEVAVVVETIAELLSLALQAGLVVEVVIIVSLAQPEGTVLQDKAITAALAVITGTAVAVVAHQPLEVQQLQQKEETGVPELRLLYQAHP